MKSISIVLAGKAGQGIQTVEQLLTRILKLNGFHVFATKEYMSRIRGGANSTEIRVGSGPVRAFVSAIDILIPLDQESLVRVASRVDDNTLTIGDKEQIGKEEGIIHVPFMKLSKEIGGAVYANIIAAGIICGLLEVDDDIASSYLQEYFARKEKDVVDKNVEALRTGQGLGKKLVAEGRFTARIDKEGGVKEAVLLNGAEAVSHGAVSGGCNFIASYPMSPATGVLVGLSKLSKEFDIVAEQAEDEIAAINMAIGAWYAGARAMVTTSGGGFDLMAEGVSLSGITETPVVIHVGQRPGPGTGLPTRSEQADLDLVLHAGHGEFPRVVLAPATLKDGIALTRKAFEMADKYQVPAFILTDQYYMDSYYDVAGILLPDSPPASHVVSMTHEYERYKVTGDGISPRGIPGKGTGLVCVDSDEHDESGHITEDYKVRVQQNEKRMKKLSGAASDFVQPRFKGREDYQTLVIGWGSTYHGIQEALAKAGREDVAHLHFSQVYPVPEVAREHVAQAKKVVVVEMNYTSQFGRLLQQEAGLKEFIPVVKYSGEPFSVEELAATLQEVA